MPWYNPKTWGKPLQNRHVERQVVRVDDLSPPKTAYRGNPLPGRLGPHSYVTGEKFFGGMGTVPYWTTDYWALRQWSAYLFDTNIYARGIIRRLISAFINTGVKPECTPLADLLDFSSEDLARWADGVENQFEIWANDPELCDYKQQHTLWELQKIAEQEGYICGDCLIVLRQHPVHKSPTIEIIPGNRITNPAASLQPANTEINHGIEWKNGRQVAFWVLDKEGKHVRIPAIGPKTGRKQAWLYIPSDKRYEQVRGMPLLALVLQSIKELDVYRDAETRKAVVNSFFAMIVTRDQDKLGSLPVQGSATKKTEATVSDADASTRKLTIADLQAGTVLEELAPGEDVKMHSPDSQHGASMESMEHVILSAIAWTHGIAPEVLIMRFGTSYSASTAAQLNFRQVQDVKWASIGTNLMRSIWCDWIISESLQQRMVYAQTILDAWRDPQQFQKFGAWCQFESIGSITGTADPTKMLRASAMMIEIGLTTHAREARIINGTKWRKNVQRLKEENAQLVDARRPLAEFKAEFGINGEPTEDPAAMALAYLEEQLEAALEDFSENLSDES